MGKRLLLFFVCAILLNTSNAPAQGTEGDAILGAWLTEDGKAAVEIYRCDSEYCGRILWLKEPKNPDGTDVLDAKNPDPSKRNRKVLGLTMFWGFSYDGDRKWVGGSIYDPDNGKTYSCKMTLDNDTLKVRGFVGISLFGRTTVWKRKR